MQPQRRCAAWPSAWQSTLTPAADCRRRRAKGPARRASGAYVEQRAQDGVGRADHGDGGLRLRFGPKILARRATLLGCALRLAYTLSAGTPDVLAGTRLLVNGKLILQLRHGTGVFAGESLIRRLERLAQAVGMEFETATV